MLEKGDGGGAFWQKTYDRLRLHSPWHRLPHDGDIDTAYPAFKTRNDVVQYFSGYVALHAIEAWFQFGETVTRVKYLAEDSTQYRQDPQYRWHVTSTSGIYLSKFVAICTSTCRVPFVPVFPGQDVYQGTLLHSATFQNGKPFQDQKVLVIGSGNSASDIALDLVEHGASEVAMLVNGPRHFARLRTQGWLMKCLKLFGQTGPKALERIHPITFGTPQFVKEVKRIDAARWLILDMQPYGIPRPESGFGTELLLNGRVPVSDMGTVDHIKKGDIRIITGRVERFTEQGILDYESLFRCHRLSSFLADFEAKDPGGIQSEHLSALVIIKHAHGPLYRLGRVWPGPFVVGIVVGPHEVINQPVFTRQGEPGRVFTEGREAMGSKVLAGTAVRV